MEQYLSDGADVHYEYEVSSDYHCTDEDDHVHNVVIVLMRVAQFIFVYALITTLYYC